MSTTNQMSREATIEQIDQEERLFLYQIKKELDLESSHDAVKYVASVLHALRQTLTLEHAKSLLNQLPDFLKLAFASGWQQQEQTVPVHHLDELVNLVIERDERQKKGLFKNEVQTLTVIVLTLKKIQKLIDLENFEGLSPALRQELRDLPSSAAA